MRKRYLTLSCTQAEAKQRLRKQLRILATQEMVEDDKFQLRKRLPGALHARGLPLYFCFYGQYYQSGKHIHLIYRIRPGFSICFMYSLVGLTTAYQACSVILGDAPIGNVLFLLGFLLIYFLIIQLQKIVCIADFEKQLTTENPTKNRR